MDSFYITSGDLKYGQLLDIFYAFHMKKEKKHGFYEKCLSENKTRQNALGLTIKFYY